MKNTWGAKGLERDLLSPCVVFLSAPSCRHLQDPADSTMNSSPVDLLWVFPSEHFAALESLQHGVDSARLMDSTEDEDDLRAETGHFHPSSDRRIGRKNSFFIWSLWEELILSLQDFCVFLGYCRALGHEQCSPDFFWGHIAACRILRFCGVLVSALRPGLQGGTDQTSACPSRLVQVVPSHSQFLGYYII